MTSSFQLLRDDLAVSDVSVINLSAGIPPTDLLRLCADHASRELDCLPLRAFARLLEPMGAAWADYGLVDEEETDEEETESEEEWDEEEDWDEEDVEWEDDEFEDEDWDEEDDEDDEEDWDEDDEDSEEAE